MCVANQMQFYSAAVSDLTYPIPSQDVDIIVLTDMDAEEIKDLLVSTDSKFFAVPSANPDATYHVLWYSLPAPRSATRCCKVDILTPMGDLLIPNIPVRRITYIARFPDIPVIPLLALLILKLQGWTDHRDDNRQFMRDKQPNDEDDINELLVLALEEYGVELRTEKWMPRSFVRRAKQRVAQFVEDFPDSADYWSEIGFMIS